jgi:hypothetical protein
MVCVKYEFLLDMLPGHASWIRPPLYAFVYELTLPSPCAVPAHGLLGVFLLTQATLCVHVVVHLPLLPLSSLPLLTRSVPYFTHSFSLSLSLARVLIECQDQTAKPVSASARARLSRTLPNLERILNPGRRHANCIFLRHPQLHT